MIQNWNFSFFENRFHKRSEIELSLLILQNNTRIWGKKEAFFSFEAPEECNSQMLGSTTGLEKNIITKRK